MFLFVLIIFIIAGLFIIPVIGNLLHKPISSNAKVIHKDIWGGGEHKMAGGRYITVSNGYRITFEFDDLTTLTLLVPKKIYYGVSIGSAGILTYYGKTFVKFNVIEDK